MEGLEVGDKVRISTKTHVGATPYQGKRGEVVQVVPDSPHGYYVRLDGEDEVRFFLDWEVVKEEEG